MRIRQSFCYPLFKPDDCNLETLFAAAASIGYAAIETWHRNDSFEEVIALAKHHRLAIASICGHQSLTKGLNNPDNHPQILDELAASIDFAAKHHIPNLICFTGNRLPNQPEADALHHTAAALRQIAPHAEKHNINLNLELLNSKINHPNYQADHTATGLKICQLVNRPNVKLLYDIYHMQIMEGNIIRTIRENIAHIAHFHTAGNPGRHNLTDDQELNYPAICRAIAATDYQGYLGHEFWPQGDKLAALRQAFTLCDQGFS